jgi:Uma2 family endonuclease
MAPTTAPLTADEFLVHPAAQGPSELVRGEIRPMTPASGRHGIVAGNVFGLLRDHVRARGLGRCIPDNVGFHLPIPGQATHTVRAPDAAFVSTARMPPPAATHGFLPTAPDLAVEVVSPSETASTLLEKLDDYLAAGSAVVWVIDPERRTIEVHTRDAPVRRLHAGDVLDGAPVLPDFRCAVAELFEGLDAG